MRKKRLAIFASGNGSNAENIIRYFNGNDHGLEIALIVCNKANAGVIERAERLKVDCKVMAPVEIKDRETMLHLLDKYSIDGIVLAGFLLMIPTFIIQKYPEQIVNIHPSLLPKYGGKGMYGRHVHEAVVAAKEKESGITIHQVSEEYDKGRIIFQTSVALSPDDNPADVEQKIHQLEQEHFPKVIEKYFLNL